jgi:hypothetical protein
MTIDSSLRRRLALGAVFAAALTASIVVPTPSQSAQDAAAHHAKPHHPASAAARQMHARGGRLVVPAR